MARLYIHVTARDGAGINDTITAMIKTARKLKLGVTCEFNPGLFIDCEPLSTHEEVFEQFEQHHGVKHEEATTPLHLKGVSRAAVGVTLGRVANMESLIEQQRATIAAIRKDIRDWSGLGE